MASRQNLVVYQGADFRRALEFKDGANVLINLTGYVFRGQARTSVTASSPSFSFTFTLRNQTTNSGYVDMHIAAAATSALALTKETNYFYDIEMVNSSGDITRIMEGQVKVYPEVTR